MVAYYISYGEPPRRFRWWLVAVLGVAGLLGMGAAVGIWQYRAGDDDEARAEAPPAATFADAVSEAFAPGADTMYLVDISGSIEASGHLRAVRQALSALALDASGPAGAAVASGSRASLLTLGGERREPEKVIELTPLDTPEAQDNWLVAANGLAPSDGGGSFIYDAVKAALRQLPAEGSDDDRGMFWSFCPTALTAELGNAAPPAPVKPPAPVSASASAATRCPAMTCRVCGMVAHAGSARAYTAKPTPISCWRN